jgi:hypothetical protein
MSISDDLDSLADELEKGVVGIKAEKQTFPSGAVWLDVHLAGRLFVFAYQPTGQYFGVDEFDIEEHGIGTHFRFTFDTFQSARDKLLSLLKGAGFELLPNNSLSTRNDG